MEERQIRQKQEDDRAAFKRLQEDERKRLEEERNRTKEELLLKRQEYKEKTKNALLFSESFAEKKKGSLLRCILWCCYSSPSHAYSYAFFQEVVDPVKVPTMYPILVAVVAVIHVPKNSTRKRNRRKKKHRYDVAVKSKPTIVIVMHRVRSVAAKRRNPSRKKTRD